MQKNPVEGYMDNTLAAIFTMMLPGLGQMLKDKIIPGIIWSVLVGGGYLVNGWFGLALHVLCILDAAINGGVYEFVKPKNPLKKLALLIGLTALITYTCLRTALF